MNPMARNLAVIGVVLLFGAGGGIMLGNFAAGGSQVSGANELAAYFSDFDTSDGVLDDEVEGGSSLRSGPSSYECVGCDAGLHRAPEAPDMSDYLPAPSYEVIDLAPPRQGDVSSPPPLVPPTVPLPTPPPVPPTPRSTPALGQPVIVAPSTPDAPLSPPVSTAPASPNPQ